jgi:hypothetical protein
LGGLEDLVDFLIWTAGLLEEGTVFDKGTECDRGIDAAESRVVLGIELLESIDGDDMLSGMGKAVWSARLRDVSAGIGELEGDMGSID